MDGAIRERVERELRTRMSNPVKISPNGGGGGKQHCRAKMFLFGPSSGTCRTAGLASIQVYLAVRYDVLATKAS